MRKMGFLKKNSSFTEDEDQDMKVDTPPSNYGWDYDDTENLPSPPPKRISLKQL
jgi:hypothetical protein